MLEGLNARAKLIYEANKAKGFWDKERNVGEMLMLVTSELSEALEASRDGKFFTGGHRLKEVVSRSTDEAFTTIFKDEVKDTYEDEIADAIIRLLDMAGGQGIDIDFHIDQKLRFNATRARLHGKKF